MKYFSMFSGIGGFELGIQLEIPWAKCVGFSEIDPTAISIYQRHFKDHKNYGDATKINPKELPDFDLLVGGFPCQAFSVAGKRAGFGDTRGTLFFEIARIVKQKQPRVLVLENVKGLLSHEQGRTYATIIATLDELGYDTQRQTCNSKNHGVPQNRERVFIVGYFRASEQSAREILPVFGGNQKTISSSRQENITNTLTTKPNDSCRPNSFVIETQQQEIKCIGSINPSGNGANGKVFDTTGLSPTLTTNKGEGIKVIELNKDYHKTGSKRPIHRNRYYSTEDLSPALNTSIEPKIVCYNSERGWRDKDPNPNRGGGSGILSRDDGISYALTSKSGGHLVQIIFGSQAHRVYCPSGIAVALQSQSGGLGAKTGLYSVEDGKIRRLMPIECERLQSLPDNWTKYGVNGALISNAQQYKCCGNTVTVNAVRNVIKKVKSMLISHSEEKKMLIPRVVRFSGGRSSAMMLERLLQKDELKAWRGDCVVFCNTSAEHSETYNFVRRMKHITEEQGIPFFMIEYQTYETKNSRNKYTRRVSYRLVNEYPYNADSNPNGYKGRGEVFKEYLSKTGALPSTYQRTCTINLKIIVNNLFLTDYWSGKTQLEELGHGDGSFINDSDVVATHKRYNGELSDAEIITKKKFLQICSTVRKSQTIQDYTKASTVINNAYLKKSANENNLIKLIGKQAISFISYLGIRYDEKHRVGRVRKKILEAKRYLNLNSKNKKKARVMPNQPQFEIIKAPLVIAKVISDQVIEYWRHRKDYDLVLPYNGLYSNCVFCFMKGDAKRRLLAYNLNNQDTNTPSSIHWWSDIEQQFSRKVIKSTNNNYTNIGFFGASTDYKYQEILKDTTNSKQPIEVLIQNAQKNNHDWTMDCSCTD